MTDPEIRKDKILGFMNEDSYKPLKLEELAVVLDVPENEKQLFKEIIEQLTEEGRLFKSNKERYSIPEKLNLVVGVLMGNERGFGFLRADGKKDSDLYIAAENMGGAMHNDRVLARITRKGDKAKRSEGEIIKILKRANQFIVGTFEKSRNFGFVVSDDKKIQGDIFIPAAEFNGALTGQKVVAEITVWPDSRRNAEGRIAEIIGNKDDAGTDIACIIKSYDLSEDFPEPAVKEAEKISEVVPEAAEQGRRDLRALTMVTIDGEDAKDLDDAVSLEKLSEDVFRLGVHIADVSYYVKEGSELDKEAFSRGTSVYLVDRVIPMLPRKLSNGICSLNPQVDRLSFSVLMDVDRSGNIQNHEIFESVININERMTYTNVFKILAGQDAEISDKFSKLIPLFRSMEELAGILKKRRETRGAIDFDFPEVKVILDEKGKASEVVKREMTIANSIVEEFMLVCNETVAEHFNWSDTPFVYRVHEEPDAEKILTFSEFARNLGYPLKGVGKIHPRALQSVLNKVKGTPEEAILSHVMLRSLAKARYSNENLGHFGLAAKYYCHFTSPIRRYPDLIIHRIMKEYLKGSVSSSREERLRASLPEIALHCSVRERQAEEAERDTEDLKKVEYMKSKEGESFEGVISNVTSFGMYVQLENTIEGLVKLSSIEDDYYIFDDKHFCLTGERTKRMFRVGEKIKVIIAKADIEARQLDFVLDETGKRAQRRNGSIGHRGKNSSIGRSRKSSTAGSGVSKGKDGSGSKSKGAKSSKSGAVSSNRGKSWFKPV